MRLNRSSIPRVHEGTLIGIVSVAYGRLSVAPGASYCDMLRGGYEYDADSGLPEEGPIANRAICNQIVAATNELVFGGDDCERHVEATFESTWDEDDPLSAEQYVQRASQADGRGFESHLPLQTAHI